MTEFELGIPMEDISPCIEHYALEDLVTLLSNKCNTMVREFPIIKLQGEIISCKVFTRNTGISFSIRSGEYQFRCRAWSSMNIDIHTIKSLENTTCSVIGRIKRNYFNHNFEFLLELSENVTSESDDSTLKRLKELCEMNGYFDIRIRNKKLINWNVVKTIGIISKRETQGYNDFITQFKIPVTIILKEITLEGENTKQTLISAINEFNEDGTMADVIIIIRGGGSTIDISNSFDKIEIFDTMVKSRIPIITAIGHEADKGDKLVITRISDLDYPTPTRAAIEINEIMISPIIDKFKEELGNISDIFEENIGIIKEKEFANLQTLFDDAIKLKFGGVIVPIDSDYSSEFIIIQQNNTFYKLKLQNMLANCEKMSGITEKDVQLKTIIQDAIINEDVDIVKKHVKFITADVLQKKIINETIKRIKLIEKLSDQFENTTAKRHESVYCNYKILRCRELLDKLEAIKRCTLLVNLYEMHLWYIDVLENLNTSNSDDIKDVYAFGK